MCVGWGGGGARVWGMVQTRGGGGGAPKGLPAAAGLPRPKGEVRRPPPGAREAGRPRRRRRPRAVCSLAATATRLCPIPPG